MNQPNHSNFEVAYLPTDQGIHLPCTLSLMSSGFMELAPTGPTPLEVPPGTEFALAIHRAHTDRTSHVPCLARGFGRTPGSVVVSTADPEGLMAAARTADAYNRRSTFRVSTLTDGLAGNSDRRSDAHAERDSAQAADPQRMHIEFQAGSRRSTAKMLDLSLSGCRLLLPSEAEGMYPELGARAFVEARGADLDQPLRIPAQVIRRDASLHLAHVALSFLRGENRSWKRVENQIGRYLALHQQRQIHRRAG